MVFNVLRFRVVFRLLFVLLLFVSRCFVFYVIRFHFFKEERGHGESGRLGATRAGSDPPVVILIFSASTKVIFRYVTLTYIRSKARQASGSKVLSLERPVNHTFLLFMTDRGTPIAESKE